MYLIWYIDGRAKRRQRGGFFPFAALKAPIIGNLALLILEKIIGEGRKKMQALSIWLETKYCYVDE